MVEQADRAELRKLVDSERQALAEMQASVGEQGADVTKLDAWIKASGKMATAARVHFPALLDELDAADLASLPCKSGEGAEAITYAERVEYETRILAAEMEVERARKVLRLFSDKADKWEANHPRNTSGTWPDSAQVQHRLGDFRAARVLSQRFDRLAEGLVEIPFAWCCAEGGGSVTGCDCVKKDHGTAWSHPQDVRNPNRVNAEVQS